MVTVYKMERKDDSGNIFVELRGLSTDSKPTSINGANILNGSEFLEIDTQALYLYDGENSEWLTPTTPDDNEQTPDEPGEE